MLEVSSHRTRALSFGAVGAAIALFALTAWAGSGPVALPRTTAVPQMPTEAFRPSNARTVDGKLIPSEQFFPSTRCAGCHSDTHASWSESLHRNAAREPFYRESADLLLNSRGIEFTRHCESCHTPVALFSGALTKGSTESRALDDEGVTCTVCHSIVAATTDGTGSFTIRRPALLVREDGSLVVGDVPDAEILANVPDHKRAMMRPLLKSPEFCATCHKVTSPPDLNGYKQILGFSAYDEWQQSGASLETVSSYYRRPKRVDCRACHMPRMPSYDDRAAKDQTIASHRWLGANTAAPLFYGQHEQVKMTEAFLAANVVDIDLFALRHADESLVAPLQPDSGNRLAVSAGEEVTVDVVVSNRNAAHTFPPEVRDLYEAWVEFEALDNEGRLIYHSGGLEDDGMLDPSAHVYKLLMLDGAGRPITRHQVWLTAAKAYDNFIPPGRSDVVRYRFRIPEGLDGSGAVRLKARVNYRRFNQEYTSFVLKRRNATLVLPVVRMAESSLTIVPAASHVDSIRSGDITTAKRWNDYGIGLMEQAQFGSAAIAFRRAAELDRGNPDLLVSAAIAEMRTERFGHERTQLRKAIELLERASALDATSPRVRYFRAIAIRGDGRVAEAAEMLASLAREYPRDREIWRQLGQTLLTLGRRDEAEAAFLAVLGIDPLDAGAYQFLASVYAAAGRLQDARRAEALYHQYREDPGVPSIAARFFATNPQWSEERIRYHTHGSGSPGRPVLSGALAAPEQ